VREAGSVLDADEEDRLAVEVRDAGVEDRVDRVRPAIGAEDRVPLVASEQLLGAQDSHLINPGRPPIRPWNEDTLCATV